MRWIAHQCNTIKQLESTPERYGVEVDLRSSKVSNHLVLSHDPFNEGESFEEWLQGYHHGTLILNVKEEGLEAPLIALMKRYQITDYFFLDQSFPFLIKWMRSGHRQSAVRFSEFESIHTALTLSGRIDWVWVDYFTKFPLDQAGATALIHAGFRLCLVSPELQGHEGPSGIRALAAHLRAESIRVHAVCTKYPDLWESLWPLTSFG